MHYLINGLVNVQVGVQQEIEANSKEEALEIFKQSINTNLNSQADEHTVSLEDLDVYESTVKEILSSSVNEIALNI